MHYIVKHGDHRPSCRDQYYDDRDYVCRCGLEYNTRHGTLGYQKGSRPFDSDCPDFIAYMILQPHNPVKWVQFMKDKHCTNILRKQKLVERENGILRLDLGRANEISFAKETELADLELENGILRQDFQQTKEILVQKETELADFKNENEVFRKALELIKETLLGKETELSDFENENEALREDLKQAKESLEGKKTELVEFALKLKLLADHKYSSTWWIVGIFVVVALAVL